ncbi:peptidase domain-containing ABC transporter [Candidatus Laterigemmans baculatus]|uniref:peptidase domain-containing ABC transporter n=1 Tax=Candidatus Laterigemmans baculatus TaxID=2770505 RepID=UPI0013DA355E|nr:ABC transporter ATP-binding protein [Candidatus Laterigemmans baculatus]
MWNPADTHRAVDGVEEALAILERFCDQNRVPRDSAELRRWLLESLRAVPGEGANGWMRRLISCGGKTGLRVGLFEARPEEALPFVRQGYPVAFALPSEDPTEPVAWQVLTGSRGRKVRVWKPAEGNRERWMSRRRFLKRLACEGASSCRWLVAQPALGCAAAAEQGKPLTPLARLAAVLQPERRDIISMIIFSVMVGVFTLATPLAVEALVNTVAFGRYLQPIMVLAFLLFSFLSFAAGLHALLALISEMIQRRLFVRVVEDLAHRLPRVRQSQLDGRYGPELVNRFFDVVMVQKATSRLLLDGIALVVATLVGMAVLAFYHPFLLGFDVLLLAMMAVSVFVLGRGAVSSATKESKAKYEVAGWLEELVRNPTAFRLHSGSHHALERSDQLAVDYLDARQSHFRILMRQILFSLGFYAIAATVLLGLGGWLVIQGELTLGQLVAAEMILAVILGAFAKIGKQLESFYDLLAAVDKLGQLFDLRLEPTGGAYTLIGEEPVPLRLDRVSVAIAGRSILKDVSLEVDRGASLAVTGASGSGKSTLLSVLTGERGASSGYLQVAGIDFREIDLDSYREQLGISRGNEVFAGTLAENVHLHRAHIRPQDVSYALRLVGLEEEVLALPDGTETQLTTGGRPLSETQAARLALARAIAARPRVLLIDGTLDGLPADTARTVLANLLQAPRPWTLLVATSRRELADLCDREYAVGRGDVHSGLSSSK